MPLLYNQFSLSEKDHKKRIKDRVSYIADSFELFKKKFFKNDNSVYIDTDIMQKIVTRFFLDVDRLKLFHNKTKLIDCFKQAGLATYWINKFKPIKIQKPFFNNKYYGQYNEYFAMLFGKTFIMADIKLFVNKHKNTINKNQVTFINKSSFENKIAEKNFLYSLENRNMDSNALILFYQTSYSNFFNILYK